MTRAKQVRPVLPETHPEAVIEGTWRGGIYRLNESLGRLIFVLVIISVPSGASRILGGGGPWGTCTGGVPSRGCVPYSGSVHCRSQKTTLGPVPSTSNGETNSTLRGIQAQCQAGMFPERQEAMACQRGCEGFLSGVVCVVFLHLAPKFAHLSEEREAHSFNTYPAHLPRLIFHCRMSTPFSLALPSPSSEQSRGGCCHLSKPPFLVCDMVVN